MSDFSIPSEDCFLTVDKNGTVLKVGDTLVECSIPLRGLEPEKRCLKPIEDYQGNLVIPHYGSFLVSRYVEIHCEVI